MGPLPPLTLEWPFYSGQIVICGDPQAKDTKALLQCVHTLYIPNKVPVPGAAHSPPRLPSMLPLQRPGVLPQVTPLPCPRQVLILADGDPSSFLSRQLPFLNTLRRLEDQATAYVCENQACSVPITEPCELRKLLLQ